MKCQGLCVEVTPSWLPEHDKERQQHRPFSWTAEINILNPAPDDTQVLQFTYPQPPPYRAGDVVTVEIAPDLDSPSPWDNPVD